MTVRALVLAALVAGPAAAQTVPDRLADLRLTTAVRLALVADPATRPLDVGVAARRGAVALRVEAGALSREVARVVRAVPGVRALEGSGFEGTDPSEPSLDTLPGAPVVIEPRSVRPDDRSEGGPLTHTVRRGDTLFGIARRYDTTIEAILALNDRRSTAVRIGERLRVR